MKIQAGFKYRIYPNCEQQQSLAVHFGHSRYVYNTYLAVRRDYYDATGKNSTYSDCTKDLTQFKRESEFAWLKDADAQVLQQSLKDLDSAFQRFFKGISKYPSFKSKYDKQSCRWPQRFKLNDNKLYLPKVGWVKFTLHRPVQGKMKSVTVSKTKSGKYFASILCEWEQDQPQQLPNTVGIDLGITHFATLSTGEKVKNPRNLKRNLRRLQIRQRRLSRKAKGSNNRNKARHRVAVTHERVANQRRDFHHKLSRRLVDEFGHIALESLDIPTMLQNRYRAQSIHDVSWGQFVQFLKYKQEWNGGTVDQVEQSFASSHICSACGVQHQKMSLSVREWTCKSCGATHDRDINASKNILLESQNTVGATEINALEIRPAVTQSAGEILSG